MYGDHYNNIIVQLTVPARSIRWRDARTISSSQLTTRCSDAGVPTNERRTFFVCSTARVRRGVASAVYM